MRDGEKEVKEGKERGEQKKGMEKEEEGIKGREGKGPVWS